MIGSTRNSKNLRFEVDKVGLSLILISSVLLGVWATTHTIALRNFLLVLGALVTFLYWIRLSKSLSSNQGLLKMPLIYWMPITFIGVMFLWVVIHYMFLSLHHEKQWDELTSTWLRALLATFLGSATGLALHRNKRFAWLLWLGLVISFLVLICQYIPKAMTKQSLYATDYFGGYIFWAKFNGVLVGVILIAGLMGLSFDKFRNRKVNLQNDGRAKYLRTFVIIVFVTLGIFLPIFCFVYIFSAKNGMGITAILFIFWFMFLSISFAINVLKKTQNKFARNFWIKSLLANTMIFLIFIFFAFQHVKDNPGWGSLIKDIFISVQIDKYDNWRDPTRYGYPKRDDGTTVAGNLYERISYAMVGLRLIRGNLLGSGISRSFPLQMEQGGISHNSPALYTHSAWLDFGLMFGLPGLCLLPLCLILCLILSLYNKNQYYRCMISSLSLAILLLYLVGEYGFQHGIEILLFLCSLLATLILKSEQGKISYV